MCRWCKALTACRSTQESAQKFFWVQTDSQSVLTTALEVGACDTFVFDAETISTAKQWAKLASFRALLIDGSTLAELNGEKVCLFIGHRCCH